MNYIIVMKYKIIFVNYLSNLIMLIMIVITLKPLTNLHILVLG